MDYLTTHTSLSPILHGFAPDFVNYKKVFTRLVSASDKVYQLLPHGRWFSPGTLASSTTKTGRHDIAEILLKVALKHQKSILYQDNNNILLKRYINYLRHPQNIQYSHLLDCAWRTTLKYIKGPTKPSLLAIGTLQNFSEFFYSFFCQTFYF